MYDHICKSNIFFYYFDAGDKDQNQNTVRAGLHSHKQNPPCQSSDKKAGGHIAGIVDASQDADQAQNDREDQAKDARGDTQGQHAHGDDRAGKDMAAGHGVSFCIFTDQRADIMLFVGALPVQKIPCNADQREADSRDQNVGKGPVNASLKAGVAKTGQEQAGCHKRINDVHGQCESPVEQVQDADPDFFPADPGRDPVVKDRIIVIFHISYFSYYLIAIIVISG